MPQTKQPKTASKFTPGPYLAEETTKNYEGYELPPAFDVSDGITIVAVIPCTSNDEDYDKAPFNARLIAQAPDMYELLELVTSAKLRYSAEGIGSFGPTDSIRWQDIQQEARRIKAAIDGEG